MHISYAPARTFALVGILALILSAFTAARQSTSVATTDSLEPAGELRELSIDDGASDCAIGLEGAEAGFGWVNKLTPPSYPATLRAITIGFNRAGAAINTEQRFRIVVYLDPEMDGPSNNQQPAASFIGVVRGTSQFTTFNLISALTITGGSFVIGAIDELGVGDLPALIDVPGRSTPPGSESFITFNGGVSWQPMTEVTINGPPPCNQPGSWLIRATVETGSADVLSVVTTIKDPLAVEPWSVGFGTTSPDVYVTNYVSDNLTVINIFDNTFRNIAVGDGPGGTPDGPYGVVARPNSTRVYVTLFGSNTLPSKEFPIDYSLVGPGRVLVLDAQNGGNLAQVVQIAVGKGPRFPALSSDGAKLYVPCGGANRVDVISTTSNEKIKEIAVGADPSSCTLSLDGSKLYVTNFGSGSVSVIDTKTDQKVKDIEIPSAGPIGILQNPWTSDISPANGNLYVTFWGGTRNGSIAVIDTCEDTITGIILDDAAAGTPPGSAGASGIPAPTGPLARDPATGTTPGAGGGGGGPFGITSCQTGPAMVFTNDGLGIIGVLDSRINQVVSIPPLSIAACPKPRDLTCGQVSIPGSPPGAPPVVFHRAFVACGQPDNSVAVVNIPRLPQNIVNVPVIESVDLNGKFKINGRGFAPGIRIQVIVPGSSACLTFSRPLQLKRGGTLILQKGKLSDGRSLKDAVPVGGTFIIRIISEDGTVTVFRVTRTS